MVEYRSPKPGVGGSSPSWPVLGIMKQGNIFKRMKTYLADVRGELKKVSWPTFADMQKTTIAVIVLSIIFGIYLTAIDLTFRTLVDKVISLFK